MTDTTLTCGDSVRVSDLPPGYDAYLGYGDGIYNTAAQLRARFPRSPLIILTVTGASSADGVDIERFDLSPSAAVSWVKSKLGAGQLRPVMYASVGLMQAQVLPLMANAGVNRSDVRLLTAHYGARKHICGPGTCTLLSVDADGTQWTNTAVGYNSSRIDASVLRSDFFATSPTDWTGAIMQQLTIIRPGETGVLVRTIQGLCTARGRTLTIDGEFGPLTADAVRALQSAAHITVDGTVGPQTWPVLLGIA